MHKTSAHCDRLFDSNRLHMQCKTLREFDDRGTRRMFGFANVDEYYSKSSSRKFLGTVGVPLLCINALDDPIVPSTVIPSEPAQWGNNPNIIICTTRRGGHVGWLEDNNPFAMHNSWADSITMRFFQALLEARADSVLMSKSLTKLRERGVNQDIQTNKE